MVLVTDTSVINLKKTGSENLGNFGGIVPLSDGLPPDASTCDALTRNQ